MVMVKVHHETQIKLSAEEVRQILKDYVQENYETNPQNFQAVLKKEGGAELYFGGDYETDL
jgi:hypothetical protein